MAEHLLENIPTPAWALMTMGFLIGFLAMLSLFLFVSRRAK